MTDYNLGRVVGTDGVGIQSISSILEATGRTKVVITLTTGTTETFYIEKGTKGDTGTGIRKIELISTVGKEKNYRITFTDNTTFDYTITDGEDAVCDTDFDEDSENAVQNKVITNVVNTINTTLETKLNEKEILQLLHDYGHASDSPVTRITLESDKDILSYADGDTATLTATAYDTNDNGVANQIVVFYKDGKVLDTGVTDANGEATYEYTSEGAGDITFGASVGRFFIETYEVEDCIRYDSNTYNATQLLLYPLESTFKIEYETLISTTSGNSCYISIGEDTTTSLSKSLLIGKVDSTDTQYKIYARNGGDVITTGLSIQVSNDFQDNVITYDGTELVFNNDINITNFNGISLDKIIMFSTWKEGTTSGQVKNIKIKPL